MSGTGVGGSLSVGEIVTLTVAVALAPN